MIEITDTEDLTLTDDINIMRDEEQSNELLKVNKSHIVKENEAGMRFDKICAVVFDEFSRAQLQGWITEGELTIKGEAQKPKYRVKVGEEIVLSTELVDHSEDKPENIPLDIIYEDDDVVVVNKPAGMVVHPGAGNWTGTLVNALLYHYPNQAHLPRAGLVHRIDKDTTGLLLIAKNKVAQLDLMDQLKDKSVYRHYQCLVAGDLASLRRHPVIDLPIGRHKVYRTKMTVTDGGRDSVTHIKKITEILPNYSLLDVSLETGRTHQIRVHLSHLGFPLVGDKQYGQRQQLRAGLSESQRNLISGFGRQALHAYKLGFIHPVTGEEIQVSAPLSADIQELISNLQS